MSFTFKLLIAFLNIYKGGFCTELKSMHDLCFLSVKIIEVFSNFFFKFKNTIKVVLLIIKLMHSNYTVLYASLVCNKLAEFKAHVNVPEPKKHSMKYHSIGII